MGVGDISKVFATIIDITQDFTSVYTSAKIYFMAVPNDVRRYTIG
jgi:hypothetical protein